MQGQVECKAKKREAKKEKRAKEKLKRKEERGKGKEKRRGKEEGKRDTYPIDDEQLATYVHARAAGEEDDRSRKVLGGAPARGRNALRDLAEAGGVRKQPRIPI
jgi:hypothetical protein